MVKCCAVLGTPRGRTKREKRAHDGSYCNVAQRCMQRCNDNRHGPFFSHDSVDLEVPSGGEESEGVNLALQVAPSGVAITEGATGYQQ